MQDSETFTPLCKSVFKSGKNTTTESTFTQKWIELVNALEKGKVAYESSDLLPPI